MIRSKKVWISAIALWALASCADESKLLFEVEKSARMAELEYLREYDVLKSYVNRNANPNFKLGAGISVSDFLKKETDYSMLVSNFDEVVAGWEMKHGAVVQSDGSLNLGPVKSLVEAARIANIGIYGHTLCWHANQNATYLNKTIAPTIITGEPTWDPVTTADFETDDQSNFTSNAGAQLSYSSPGADASDRALKVTNPEVRTNNWESQLFVTFPNETQVGEKYKLTMYVRADVAATFPTQGHGEPGAFKHHGTFGDISATTTWTQYVAEATITDDTKQIKTIAFNLGSKATNYYFDQIKLEKYNEMGGGGPSLEASVISNSDFESGGGAGWMGWGNGSTRGISTQGSGHNNVGYAYTFTNPSAVNFWEAQTAYDLSPALQTGSTYVLNFKVKSNVAGTIRAEIQSTADYSSDGFGTFAISTEWKEYTLQTTASKADRNRFIFSFGDFAGTVYVDDVTLSRINPDGGGAQVIEKTPEEKREIIHNELDRWIAGMMEVSKDYVKAWDVVNEPMDDGNPYELKTGVGRELAADEFYWQDYLGKDYAVEAFKMAAHYGNTSDKLFINDYNLEYNLDKCKGLIEYAEYIDSHGGRVDGIGTQMHISTDSDKNKIIEMLELLAATGKLIKISELDIGVGVQTNDATDEHYKAQAEMYKFVVQKYFEIIPAQQQYGITLWSPKDSPTGSSWRAGEPIGVWTLGFNRKRAYGAVADALKEN
ncbi:endo-1,4-beta-xylanase [Pseudochryseolinea flava]|uniref:endo-1,4-beta-xylanase n=1 Tax=Pseudochryseolinea flava TaxID=2059302 RepID=A0A364Y653_9BACT|nr:endo-1,4-beta-xylanase [Pseudochryseolinea flava]RAW02574.1 1,4-beta-xylanase [Pseudochryseolinea flava]